MIIIHYDFTDGTEISYVEGLKQRDNFNTHCFEFFTVDDPASDVVVLKENDDFVSRNDLMLNNGYTNKEMRKAHDIRRMLVGGCFKFKKGFTSYKQWMQFLNSDED